MKSKVLIIFSSMLFLLIFCGCSQKQNILTYDVNPELNYDFDYDMSNFDKATKLENKILTNVESAIGSMNNTFAKNVVSIEDYGAKSSQNEDINIAKSNTKSIYQAITETSKNGGGTVFIPSNKTFYTCAIHLEDNINLRIDEGATLKFCKDTSLYLGDFMKEIYGDTVDDKGLTLTRYEGVECMNYSPFIYAYGKKNIAVTGSGTIDGQASVSGPWQDWHVKDKDGNFPFDYTRAQLFADGQNNIEVAKRQYGEGSNLRPNFVQPYNCKNILIKDIKVVNSPMWEINPVLCDTVMLENVSVISHMANNDAVDPECTSNMIIRNNHFDVGDDCVAVKSGRNGDALRINRATFNLVISNNDLKDGDGGITIGSEITGGAKNIIVHDNKFESEHLDNPYRFKTNYIRGGNIENIFFKNDNVKMVNPNMAAISVDFGFRIKEGTSGNEVQMMEQFNLKYKVNMPSIKNIKIDNLTVNGDNIDGHGGKYAMQIKGFDKNSIAKSCEVDNTIADCYITDFSFTNSKLFKSTQAFDLKYVDGLNLNNVSICGTTQKDTFINCKNFNFNNCYFTNSAIEKSKLESIENSQFNDCKY